MYLEIMAAVKLDHIYVTVKNMDRAIRFYEDLLGMKATHREGNSWADFAAGKSCYLGLIDSKIISSKRKVGNNAIPVFFAEDIDSVFEQVKKHNVKILFPPEDLAFTDYPYRCFQCEDTEGNVIEIANYQRK